MADLAAHPRDQLVAVDRLVEIVIDAEIKRFGHAFGIGLVDQHQQRYVARGLAAAQLRAQPQTVRVAELEADHDKLEGLGLCGAQRGAEVRDAADGVAGGKLVFEQRGVAFGILDDKDTRLVAAVRGKPSLAENA